MIDPTALAFDIDGVIADTMHLFLDILEAHHDIRSVRYADITAYRLDHCLNLDVAVLEDAVGRILDGRYQAVLKPIPGAGQVLRRIGEATGRILMVTARPDATLIGSWMRQLLNGQMACSQIVATGCYDDKAQVLLDNGVKWFVEDRLETCHLVKAVGIEPVVFKQPWNRQAHNYLEVASWQELARRITFP